MYGWQNFRLLFLTGNPEDSALQQDTLFSARATSMELGYNHAVLWKYAPDLAQKTPKDTSCSVAHTKSRSHRTTLFTRE